MMDTRQLSGVKSVSINSFAASSRRGAGRALVLAAAMLIGGAAMIGLGCAKTQSTMNTAPPSPQPRLASDVHERVHILQDRIADLDTESNQLPGRSDEDYRRLMNEVLTTFSQVLPLLEGPQPTNEFQQQMRIVQTDQAELANGSRELDVNPTVDEGLRSITNALSKLALDNYAQQPEVGKAIEALQGRIDELDSVLGANHRVVVTEAVTQAAKVVQLMTGDLAVRIGMTPAPSSEATPAGASQPALPTPATQPAPSAG